MSPRLAEDVTSYDSSRVWIVFPLTSQERISVVNFRSRCILRTSIPRSIAGTELRTNHGSEPFPPVITTRFQGTALKGTSGITSQRTHLYPNLSISPVSIIFPPYFPSLFRRAQLPASPEMTTHHPDHLSHRASIRGVSQFKRRLIPFKAQ